MLLHIFLLSIYNNPTIAELSIAGLFAFCLGIGWCLRSLVVEWHMSNIGIVSRSLIGLHLGTCSFYFAREVMYS